MKYSLSEYTNEIWKSNRDILRNMDFLSASRTAAKLALNEIINTLNSDIVYYVNLRDEFGDVWHTVISINDNYISVKKRKMIGIGDIRYISNNLNDNTIRILDGDLLV